MVTIWPVSFLPFSLLPLPLLPCFSRENSFPGFTVGLTCLLSSLLTQWLMVCSAAFLDLVNIRNYSQISVISDSLWGRNETVSLTQRLLASGKKFLLKKKMWTLYRPHCFPFILQSGPSIHYSILTFRHYNLFYFLEPSHSGSDVFPL